MKFWVKGISLFLIGIVWVGQTGYTQTPEHSWLFSNTKPGGSARILGIGSAQIALGGDYSSSLSNPAGLGMFNRSEFTFSPAINSYNSTARYFGNKQNNDKSVFNIPGLSYVYHVPADNRGYYGGSFGFSLTRTNDFHGEFNYFGENPFTSIIDHFVQEANGKTTAQFSETGINYNTLTGLAYFNYLIGPQTLLDPPGPDNFYFTDAEGIPFQQERVQNKGASNQWSLAYGGNYMDKFFFGASIGITSMRFSSRKQYDEFFFDDLIVDYMGFNEDLEIDGTGVNATLGIIYRPVDFFQVGASWVSPTYLQFNSNYYAEMFTQWNDFDYYNDGTIILGDEFASLDPGGLVLEYNLRTPMKFSAGVAFMSKFGFITGDVEFTNPGNAKYDSDIAGINFDGENAAIRDSYQAVMNYRIGAEGRYKMYRLRAGYGAFGNPYKNEFIKYKSYYWSAGAGVRFQNFYVDVAYVARKTKSFYFPYLLEDGAGEPVRLIEQLNTAVVTVGFTF